MQSLSWFTTNLNQQNLTHRHIDLDQVPEKKAVVAAMQRVHCPEDQAAIDRLIASFFALFDNRQPLNLEAIHELCLQEAVLIKTGAQPEICNPASFIAPRKALLENGTLTDFYEYETWAITQIFGRIATRTCTFEKSGNLNGEAFRGRGKKIIHLIKTAEGWRISSVAWDEERPGFQID